MSPFLKTRSFLFAFVFCLVSFGTCVKTWARVDYGKTKPFVFPVAPSSGKDRVTVQTVEEFIPMDMSPSQDQTYVFGNIADRSIQYFWKNSAFRYTSVGRVAQDLEKRLKTDITIRSEEGPKAIEHKFSVQLLAAQAIARLEYTGWIKAAFKYYAREAKSETQIREKVFENKDLVLSHTSTRFEDMSSLLLSWSW